MAYNKETWNIGDKITSAWANKVENKLSEVGSFMGYLTESEALPDPTNYADGDWFLKMDEGKPKIFVKQTINEVAQWVSSDYAYDGPDLFYLAEPIQNISTGLPTAKANWWTIYPITLVNLLGSYGNFEKDSNGDGWPDGWTKTGGSSDITVSIEDGIVGNYAVKISNNTAENLTFQFGFKKENSSPFYRFPCEDGHYLFASFWAQSNISIGVHITLLKWDADNNYIGSAYSTNITGTFWQKTYRKERLVSGSGTVKTFSVHINSEDAFEEIDAGHYYIVDGYSVYNLTLMSSLPRPMKQMYGVDNWSDLDADILAKWLIYVDSIQTINFILPTANVL